MKRLHIDPDLAMLVVLLILCMFAFGCRKDQRAQETQSNEDMIADLIKSNEAIHIDRFWRVVDNNYGHGDVYLLRNVPMSKCYLVMHFHGHFTDGGSSSFLLDPNVDCARTVHTP